LIGIATFPNIFPMAPLFPNRRIALRRIAVSPSRHLAVSCVSVPGVVGNVGADGVSILNPQINQARLGL
jgi:hypothetical protein